jgi:hypothetical protein
MNLSDVTTSGFELNTDASLVNPDWEDFAEAHDRRFGLAISHFKSLVKGRAYDNQVMRLRVGREGFYAQARNFPAAFFGDTRSPEVVTVHEAEAQAAVWEAVAHYRAGEAQSLTTIYSGDDPPDVFFGYRLTGERRYELGHVRTSLPLHLRVLVDAPEESPLVGASAGVLIYQRTRRGEHVLIRAAGRRQPLLAGVQLAD